MAGAPPAAEVVAIFGPTGVGKTAVAIELADRMRARGADPVAISCDSIQIYRGLEVISGAADATEQSRLEHRMIGIADASEEFSAGRFADLAEAEVAAAIDAGRIPIVVGGTGLYMRAALAELELRPPVDPAIRDAIEREVAERGPAALHGELPDDVAAKVHPNDRKRIARAHELIRSGEEPAERSTELWTAALRRPTALAGLVCDPVDLELRIGERIAAMAAAGAVEEAQAVLAGPFSRTAGAAVGLRAFAEGDLETVAREHRRLARRQLTWMRKMPGVELFEVDASGTAAAAGQTAGEIDAWLSGAASGDTAAR
jgi:tRNA dimethylallyltransferase